MDGTRISKVAIRVEVRTRPIPLSKPGSPSERRAARKGEILNGTEALMGGAFWIVFEDGYGIQKDKLRPFWDDLAVEAWIEGAQGERRELFDG